MYSWTPPAESLPWLLWHDSNRLGFVKQNLKEGLLVNEQLQLLPFVANRSAASLEYGYLEQQGMVCLTFLPPTITVMTPRYRRHGGLIGHLNLRVMRHYASSTRVDSC